ncbi:MAG TPA: glycosyltransferase [Jatrophihabitans sp.]|nr:glycosyltransferase [Jatrophihabitans sp.]
MKVAMLSEHASPLAVVGGVDAGGQNVHVAALATALAERGHEVVVYTRRDAPDLPQRTPLCPGVTVEHLAAGPAAAVLKDELLPYLPALADELRLRLENDPPAVLHAHFWMSGVAAQWASSDLEVPVVQTFHALGTVKRRFQGRADSSPESRIASERRVARSAARVIASCTDELRELVSMGTPRERIDVIPSGVDNRHFTPDGPRAERGRLHRLLALGRLVPRKGIDDAISVLRWLPDTELVVAGGPDATALRDDPEAVRLKEWAEQQGVAERVRFIGRVPHADLPEQIRAADLVVCLPWYEPFGIVPLEAMACGVPVIGSAVGGLLDTVIDGVTGMLLPPRRPQLAAAAVRDLLDDDERRARFGAAGARRVAAQYDWSRVAQCTERSYLRAAAQRSRRPVLLRTAPRKESVG